MTPELDPAALERAVEPYISPPTDPRDAEIARLRMALRIIAGEQQCIDNLMSNGDVARAALAQPVEG